MFEDWGDPATPTVTIQAITNIVTTTARGHGNVTDLGASAVTEHGHCWATTTAPTTAGSKTTLGAKAAIGEFVSELTGLTEGLTYYVRAYATNSYGTSYSSELSFVADTASDGGHSYPVDGQTRVTSLIHRSDRGTYTLEILLGEVTADFGLPEPLSKPESSISVKAAPEETEKVVERVVVKQSVMPTLAPIPALITAPTPAPTPVTELTPYAQEILETPAGKAAAVRQAGIQQGVEAVVTPYAIGVLKKYEREAQILTEIQRLQPMASQVGITSYTRSVLIKHIIKLKQELNALYASR